MRSILIMLACALSIGSAHGAEKCAALTFDDGPAPGSTESILDTLKQEGVKATFFLVGQKASANPALVQRESAEGHVLGNHSWSHPYLTRLSFSAAKEQIDRTDVLIEGLVGAKPAVIRAPFGAVPRQLDRLGDGRPFISWNPDTSDYRHPRLATLVGRALGGEDVKVILMHDIHASTARALPSVIAALRERGYRFVTVPELLAGSCGEIPKGIVLNGPQQMAAH